MQFIGIGFAVWAARAVLMIFLLAGCAPAPQRCSVQGEQVQRVGENSAGDYVRVRSFIELCKAGI